MRATRRRLQASFSEVSVVLGEMDTSRLCLFELRVGRRVCCNVCGISREHCVDSGGMGLEQLSVTEEGYVRGGHWLRVGDSSVCDSVSGDTVCGS